MSTSDVTPGGIGGSFDQHTWTHGALYESYIGRWSRLVAHDFLSWLALPPGARWLDVGCGTGALSAAIRAHAAPREIVGCDASPGYVAYARDQVQDPLLRFDVASAQALPYPAGYFDAVVSGLVLHFLPDRARAVAEMAGVTCSGGTVALYVWDYAGRMDLIRRFWDAAVALDPAANDLDEGRRFSLCHPDPLTNLFHLVGLSKVVVQAIDIPLVFRDFDDYWLPFLGGQGPAPGYTMSLDEERRVWLREHIRETLPFQADGSIYLIARA